MIASAPGPSSSSFTEEQIEAAKIRAAYIRDRDINKNISDVRQQVRLNRYLF